MLDTVDACSMLYRLEMEGGNIKRWEFIGNLKASMPLIEFNLVSKNVFFLLL